MAAATTSSSALVACHENLSSLGSSVSRNFAASSTTRKARVQQPQPQPQFAVRCSSSSSLPQEGQKGGSVMRAVVGGGLAGALMLGLAVSSPNDVAMAAGGPGIGGAERTAKEADKLLKAADKLNMEEAPKRYGPGRPGAATDPATISQKAGSGPVPSLQEGAASIQEGAKDLAGKASSTKSKVENAAKDAVSQASPDSSSAGVLGSIQEAVQGIKDSVAQKGQGAQSAAEGAAKNVQQSVQ